MQMDALDIYFGKKIQLKGILTTISVLFLIKLFLSIKVSEGEQQRFPVHIFFLVVVVYTTFK